VKASGGTVRRSLSRSHCVQKKHLLSTCDRPGAQPVALVGDGGTLKRWGLEVLGPQWGEWESCPLLSLCFLVAMMGAGSSAMCAYPLI
jgi:hypothetical protein